MSRCLRYQHKIVCEHLASQYVMGFMTQRVRRRVETLRQYTPQLNHAIASWSDSASQLAYVLPENEVNSDRVNLVWHSIDSSYKKLQEKPQRKHKISFWQSLSAWRCIAGITSFASLLLVFTLLAGQPQWFPNNKQLVVGPSYLANMLAYNSEEQGVQFVVSAYAKTKDKPSRLHVQWSKDHIQNHRNDLHLWAEDKQTGNLTYIGQQPKPTANADGWSLTKPTWLAVSNSGRLVMTKDANAPNESNILFSGLCLQLKEWRA